jgi:hypothetical protein
MVIPPVGLRPIKTPDVIDGSAPWADQMKNRTMATGPNPCLFEDLWQTLVGGEQNEQRNRSSCLAYAVLAVPSHLWLELLRCRLALLRLAAAYALYDPSALPGPCASLANLSGCSAVPCAQDAAMWLLSWNDSYFLKHVHSLTFPVPARIGLAVVTNRKDIIDSNRSYPSALCHVIFSAIQWNSS